MLAQTILFLGKHLLVLLVLAATAWVAGRVALRALARTLTPVPSPTRTPAPRERGASARRQDNLGGGAFPPLPGDWECGWERGPGGEGPGGPAVPVGLVLALGLALLGGVLLLLGLLGLLSPGPLLLVLAAVHLPGLRTWRELPRWSWRALAPLAASIPFLVLALYPPTAFDETMYHLPYIREFVRTGGMPFMGELRYPVFPQIAEVLGAAVLALSGDDVAPHLVQALATGATALLLVAWGRRYFTAAAGWMAVALFLGYPIVIYLATTGYVEAELALFVTAGLYSLQCWREEGREGWLLLAAVFAGSAAATKYLGLFFAAAFALEAAAAAPRGARARALFRFAAVSFLVLSPWYLRILAHTGNPVFPFLPRLFPSGEWTSAYFGLDMGLERLKQLPRLPWDVLFAREKLGHQPPFSPAFLLGPPLLVTAALRDRRLLRLVLLAGIYVLVAQVLPPDVRYLAAILPTLSLVLAAELDFLVRAWSGRWARPVTAALCVLCLAPSWGWSAYRLMLLGPPPVTAEQRDDYLERTLPVWPALRFLNQARGSGYTVYALHAENMFYFAEGRFLGDWNGPARYGRVLPLLPHPAPLWRELRRLESDYLLVVQGTGIRLPKEDPAFRRLFRRVYSDAASEVFELRISPSIRP